MTWFFKDCVVMTRRSIWHTFRNIDSLVTGILLPVVMMILFVVIFGGSVDTGINYVNYIVPGVILTCVAYGSSSAAMIVARDMTGGLFDRFRSLPMSRMSILVGHVNGAIVRNIISSLLVFAVAFMLGFRPSADFTDYVFIIGLLLLVMLAISWLAVVFGLIVRSVDAASAASFGILFLPYVSSAFVPLATLPLWIRGFAENQPMTPIIDILRSLLVGGPLDSWAKAVIWLVAILVISYLSSMVILRIRYAK